MSTASVTDAAWIANPFTWRNNRGTAETKNGKFIRFGIPEPRGRESDDDLKGSDRIGFEQIVITADMVGKTLAVFKGVEVKGAGDRLKSGQIAWHNWLLNHGASSEIWEEQSDGTIKIISEVIECEK